MMTPFRLMLAAVAGGGLLAICPVQAQTFPNSTLDTWVIRNGTEVPDQWQTTDDVIADSLKFRIPTGTVTKTTMVRSASGPFAAQLQTRSLLGQPVPGAIILGTSTKRRAGTLGGLPFTARPATLEFYYELSGPQAVADAPGVLVRLTRWVNGKTEVIASASYAFTALAASYARIDLPLRYRSLLAPDSLSLVFSSGSVQTPTSGTILRIDEISFAGTVTTATRDAALAGALSVWPNPSPDGRYVLAASERALLAGPLTVLDATGRVVHREAAPSGAVADTRTLDLSGLPAGLYTLQLATPRGLLTRKLSR